MNIKFEVELLRFKNIEELPNAWTNKDYTNLLELMDYDEISEIKEDELKEMCLLSLTDYEADEAARFVLEYIFDNELNKGQINNLSNELLEEKMWEEYADLSLHERFFNVTQLLYQAFNGKFPHPRAVEFEVKIDFQKTDYFSLFNQSTEVALIRILSVGMPNNTILKRLFPEQLKSGKFDDAKDIVWQFEKIKTEANAIYFKIISSEYWFHDIEDCSSFQGEILHVEID